MDWREVVTAVAPTLGGVLATYGGPAGALAGAGVAILAEVVTGQSTGDPAQDEARIASALAGGMTPELRARVIEAEERIKTAMIQAGVRSAELAADVRKAEVADTEHARRSSIDGGNAQRVFWLTVVLSTVVLGIEGAVLFVGLPASSSPELLGRILGTLDMAMMAALYYTFGSSAGSTLKTVASAAAGKQV